MKNYKGEDMTGIMEMYNHAANDYVQAMRENRYFGPEKTYYNLMQSVFYIAQYKTVSEALDYWEKYYPNCGRTGLN